MDTPILFKNVTADELHTGLSHIGMSLRLARQLQRAVARNGELPESLPGVAQKTLDEIRRHTRVPHLTQLDKIVSPTDGFTKYLFRSDGGLGSDAGAETNVGLKSNADAETFEAVRIPLLHRPPDFKYVVCVSSQVGCAMGCAFCATGRMGFRRNLAAWEIVDQVAKIQADSPHPVRGVVFMGMGEPMLNYDNVIQAARILSESCGMAIGGKAITISTAGVVPGIRRFTAERHNYRLVVSLNSADPNVRRELMPVENAYSTEELMQAMREHHEATGQRIMFAWTMMAGVNTRDEDAQMLADLTQGLPIKLDLIDVNDPTGRFRRPTQDELNAFRDALTAKLGMPVARRYSGGQDIHAACGMLANQHAR
jgi:23S rRNA (adenine2503-C2)-methyltransferase